MGTAIRSKPDVHFYIMSAASLFNNKSVRIEDIDAKLVNKFSTILVCTRRVGDREISLFVSGCSDGTENYGVEGGDYVRYTQDTGNGHRCAGYVLKIENVVHMKGNQIITADNKIGLNEKRKVWVMK